MNKFAWISLAISLALAGCNAPDEAELESASPGISLAQESAAPEEEADGYVQALAGVCRNGYKTGTYCNSNVECGKFCASGPKVNQYCNAASDCGNWCASGSKVNQYCTSNANCPGSTCVSTTCIQATCS